MRSLVPVEIKKFHADTFPCYRKGERKDNQKQIDQRPSTFVVRRRPEERKKTLDGPSCPALARLVPAARDESKKLSDILDGNEEETGRGSDLRNSRTGSIFYGFVCLHRRRKMKPVMRRH